VHLNAIAVAPPELGPNTLGRKLLGAQHKHVLCFRSREINQTASTASKRGGVWRTVRVLLLDAHHRRRVWGLRKGSTPSVRCEPPSSTGHDAQVHLTETRNPIFTHPSCRKRPPPTQTRARSLPVASSCGRRLSLRSDRVGLGALCRGVCVGRCHLQRDLHKCWLRVHQFSHSVSTCHCPQI
jgi:hypothetical protein